MILFEFSFPMTFLLTVSNGTRMKDVYREEVQRMIDWFDVDNLDLNAHEAKEMMTDFQEEQDTSDVFDSESWHD